MAGLPYDDMARVMQVLANRTRLEILDLLRAPTRLGDIRVHSAAPGEWGQASRPISRQAVRRHVDALLEIGAIDRLDGEDTEVRYVTDHARLYAVTNRLRALAVIRADEQLSMETRVLGDRTGTAAPSGPHLVVVRGVEEGHIFPLPDPKEGATWSIGRERTSAAPLEHDAYASAEHCRIQQRDGRYFLVDLATNRNGTRLNWGALGRGAIAPLEKGDVIGVGESLLLFRH